MKKLKRFREFVSLNENSFIDFVVDDLIKKGQNAFKEGMNWLTGNENIVSQASDEVKNIVDNTKDASKELDPADKFVRALFKVLDEEGDLPDGYKSIFDNIAEEQEKEVGGADISLPLVIDDESKLETKFNKQSKEEKEAAVMQAKKISGASEISQPSYRNMGGYEYKRTGNHSYSEYKSLLERKRIWDTLDHNVWNLVGIRNTLRNRKNAPNGFIDDIVLLSPEPEKKFYRFDATTTPGPVYRVKSNRAYWISRGLQWLGKAPSKNGVAIMKPGTYKYKIGTSSKGRKVFKPMEGIKINRYPLVDTDKEATNINTYSPGKVDISNDKSIQIHGTSSKTNKIGRWSAGCQVINDPSNLEKAINIIKNKNGGEVFYTLIEL